MVHDIQFQDVPCRDKTVEIMMVMERVSSTPVDKFYIWVNTLFAIEIVCSSGI